MLAETALLLAVALLQVPLALHVIDVLATLQGTDDPAVADARRLKAQWLRARASSVRSFVSKSLYHASADALERPGQRHLGLC